MKSFLIGCGIVACLGFVVLAAIVGWGVHFGSQMKKTMAENQARLKALDTQFPFKAPADGLMPEDRLLAWVRVHRAWQEQTQAMNQKPDPMSLLKGNNPFFGMMAKQAEGLQKEKMSVSECRWITGQVIGLLNANQNPSDPRIVEIGNSMGLSSGTAAAPVKAENQPGTATTKAVIVPARLASPEFQQLTRNAAILNPQQTERLLTLLQQHKSELQPIQYGLAMEQWMLIQ